MSKLEYFSPREVSLHMTADDLWVSLFGKIFDLSSLCTNENDEEEMFALLAFAGKDVTHLFDEHGEVKLHLDPKTNRIDAFLPFKKFPGVPTQEEAEELYYERRKRDEKIAEALMQKYRCQKLELDIDAPKISVSEWEEEPHTKPEQLPWWKDDKYVVGFLTRKPRWIKIMNTMIMREVKLEVCSEETIEDILTRYLRFNSHARSYTWKYQGQVLQMNQTLERNGVPDEDDRADSLRLNSEDFIPTLTLYFNHDLTEM